MGKHINADAKIHISAVQILFLLKKIKLSQVLEIIKELYFWTEWCKLMENTWLFFFDVFPSVNMSHQKYD